MFLRKSLKDRAHVFWEHSSTRPKTNNEFPMFIDDVEIVDDPQRKMCWIGRVVGLKSFDHFSDIKICDSLYFAIKKSAPVAIGWGPFEYRELKFPYVFDRQFREVPDNMVETGTQMVNYLASQNAESRWDNTILMILNSPKMALVILPWEDGVIALLKKDFDFSM